MIEWLSRQTQRYFRRNEGTTDYATIPSVTLSGDFVFSLLISTNVDTALTGGYITSSASSSSFRLAVWQNTIIIGVVGSDVAIFSASGIDFSLLAEIVLSRAGSVFSCSVGGVALSQTGGAGSSLSLTIDSMYKAWGEVTSVPNWSGILANLRIYDAGTLVRDYPLDDNSATLIDAANGQDGSVVNGAADDWGLFHQVVRGGKWQGIGLTVPPWASANQILEVS